MKLGHWSKFRNLHMYSLPQVVEIELICDLQAAVSNIQAHFQNLHIWARNLAISQSSRSCTYIRSCCHRGSKLILSALYRQRFLRYRPIFKTAILGPETWQLAKVPEVAHIFPKLPLHLPLVPNFTLFCSTTAHFQDIGNFFIFPLATMLNFNLFFF